MRGERRRGGAYERTRNVWKHRQVAIWTRRELSRLQQNHEVSDDTAAPQGKAGLLAPKQCLSSPVHQQLAEELQPGVRERRQACVARDANMGHRLAGGHSSWCPELESRTTRTAQRVEGLGELGRVAGHERADALQQELNHLVARAL